MVPSKEEIRDEEAVQAKRIHGSLYRHIFARFLLSISRTWLPTKQLRLRIYRFLYGAKYSPMNDESELPLYEYKSINALFTRGIKSCCRPIDARQSSFICPSDGNVQDIGQIHNDQIITLKDIQYSPKSLLPGIKQKTFDEWNYAVICIGLDEDCHRVFSPYDGYLEEIIHVPGACLVVNPLFQRPEFPVYTLNERMIFRFSTSGGDPFIVVMVAAWGVGNITLQKVQGIQAKSSSLTSTLLDSPVQFKRGEWFATFELGSAVILLTYPDINKHFVVSPNEKVKYGQAILS